MGQNKGGEINMIDLKKYAENEDYNGIKPDGSKIKVLIVDDSLATRKVIKNILIATNYEVVGEAEDGLKAELLYGKLMPDVITMDITMPKVDGLQALEQILRNDPNARIIMLSALGQKDAVQEAIIKGAKNYVIKPIIGDQIPRLLKAIKIAVLTS